MILTFQKEVRIQQFLHGNPAQHDVMEINTLKYTVCVCVCVCMCVKQLQMDFLKPLLPASCD